MFTISTNPNSEASVLGMLEDIYLKSDNFLRSRKESNIYKVAKANLHVYSTLFTTHRSQQFLYAKMKELYRQSESYHQTRIFFDSTKKILNDFESLHLNNCKTYSVAGKISQRKIKNIVRIIKAYNSKADQKIKSLDKSVYEQGEVFKKISEESSWGNRCKKYAILA